MAATGDQKPANRAWTYSSASGGLENNIKLSESPSRSVTKDQILVKVNSVSINPADYKVPELGLPARFVIPTPACPGMDFSGTVVAIGDGAKSSAFAAGERVFGKLAAAQQGVLQDYILTKPSNIFRVPEGVNFDEASCLGTAGLTAYQCIAPHVKEGSKVFINGGSGGTGTFGIQIAKALGAHVTTSCSGKNVELVKRLGADEVIDYTQEDVSEVLKSKGQVFSLVVDNVGKPANLYKAADHYLLPAGKFVQIGAEVGLSETKNLVSRALLPSFLGGGKRPWQMLVTSVVQDDLKGLAKLMQDRKVKSVIEETFPFEQAPEAFKKLRTGRTRGNLVIKVSE